MHRCRTEPLYFITHYCWTINAHLDGEEYEAPTVDLIPDWPHIRALVDALFPARDVVIGAAFGYMLVKKHRMQTSAERPIVRARQQNIEELLPKW